MKALDDIDRRLLALLEDDARTPVTTLAKKVGLSRSATQERLQRLEDTGVIAGYTVQRGDGAQARTSAWLSLRFGPGGSCALLVPQLAVFPEVRLCHSVAGPVDLLVLVEADSLAAVAALRERVLAMKGVAEVQTTPLLGIPLARR